MDTPRDTVVVLAGFDNYGAIKGLMESLAGLCEKGGLRVECFHMGDLTGAVATRFFETVSSGRVKFALTYLGIGQDLEVDTSRQERRNLWEFFNIPLLKLQGDSPAYYLDRHRDFPATTINLYQCEEFLEFHQAIFPESKCLSLLCDPWAISDHEERDIDFSLRERGELVFIKNGGSPDDLIALWESRLAKEVCLQLLELAHEVVAVGLQPGRLDLPGMVTSYLLGKQIDVRSDPALVCFYVAQLDDYLRRVKSTIVAKALLSCPVVIQGSHWDHLDTRGAKATLRPSRDFASTESIFMTELGIIDLSPNVDTCGHDRMMRAAGTYAFALSDKNTWLQNLLPALHDRAFTYDPEGVRSAVDAVLKDPAACIELGRSYGRAFRQRYDGLAFVEQLCEAAEMTRLRHASPKPQLQPYLVW